MTKSRNAKFREKTVSPTQHEAQPSLDSNAAVGMDRRNLDTESVNSDRSDFNKSESFKVKKMISITKSVSVTLDMVCQGVALEATSVPLVESLIWVFLARRSLRKEFFTKKEFGKFVISMRKTAKVIQLYESKDCKEQSFIKYWIDYYLAAAFKDDNRPVRGDWIKHSLFTGWCKRFIARALMKSDMSFFYSLQKGSKQMWPKLKPENMRLAILKSIDNLTKPAPPSDPHTLSMVAKVSKQIFSSVSTGKTMLGTRFMPSSSACLQASRKLGGALSTFAPMFPPSESLVKALGPLRAIELSVNDWRQKTFITAQGRVNDDLIRGGSGLFTERNKSYADADSEVVEAGVRDDHSDGSDIDHDSDDRSDDGHFLSDAKLYDVSFIGLYEPGKIRGISVGDGNLATTLQPLQGELLKAWKATPWSTMLESDLTESIRLMDENVHEPLWCSGDYEAATDKLHKDASLIALGAIPDHPLKELGLESFRHGRIYYVNPSEENFEKKPKDRKMISYPLLNGQLMGHVLSFPLLCAINLAVLAEALRLWTNAPGFSNFVERIDRARRAKLIYKYAKINGDDVLFKGTLELFQFHRQVAESVGFKISQGKNYYSAESCLINSQLFTRRNGHMVRVGYLNLRLIKGNNIKGSSRKASDDRMIVDPTHIGKEINRMVSLCPWTACAIPAAFDRWEKMNKDFKWFKPNWFIPTHLGGYGVDPKFGSNFKITKGQRLLAAIMLHDTSLLLYRAEGLRLPKLYESKVIPQIQVVPGAWEGPLESHIENFQDQTNSWLEKLSYAERASHFYSALKEHIADLSNYETTDFEMFLRANRIKRSTRLKKLSDEGFEKYRTIRILVNKTSSPGPASMIKIIRTRSEFENSTSYDSYFEKSFVPTRLVTDVKSKRFGNMDTFDDELREKAEHDIPTVSLFYHLL